MSRSELDPTRRAGVAGRRGEGHRWAHPLQRDRRGDPHRSPEALPGDDRRVGQPAALGRRQPAHARGDASARRERVHRRVHDRDGAAVGLRAARHHPVREVRGDVLQLRLPAERLPPPPAGARPAATVRCPSRRSTPASSRPSASSTATTVEPLRAGRGRAAATSSRRRSPRRPPTDPKLGRRRRRSLLYRTLGATLPHGAAAAAVAVADGDPLRAGEPRRRRPRRLRLGPRRRQPAVRRDRRQPVGGRVHRRHLGGDVATHQDRRRPRPPRDPRAPRRARRARRRDTAGRRPRTGRCSCPPASGARSRRTRSCATRRGGRRTPTVRCASRRPTPTGSVSSTATPPR